MNRARKNTMNYKIPKGFPFMTDNLQDLQDRVHEYLIKFDMEKIVTPGKITEWFGGSFDSHSTFQSYIRLLTGMIPQESLDRMSDINGFLGSLLELYKLTNRENYERMDTESVEPNQLSEERLPPLDWMDHQIRATDLLTRSSFEAASRSFDRTFEKLIEQTTTDREPDRLFYNASNAYFLVGMKELGRACLEYSFALNPKYSPAEEGLKDLMNGEFDTILDIGRISRNLGGFTRLEEDFERGDISKYPVPVLVLGLRSLGVKPSMKDISGWVRVYNSSEELVDVEFSDLVTVDKTIATMSIYGIWLQKFPEEPSIERLQDLIYRIEEVISFNMDDDLSTPIKELESMMLTDKKDFLQSFRSSDSYSDLDEDLLMDILCFMQGDYEFKGSALEMAERLREGTGDDVWSVPIAFLEEENPEKLSERLDEIMVRGDDGRKMLYIDRFMGEILDLPEPDMDAWMMDDGEGPEFTEEIFQQAIDGMDDFEDPFDEDLDIGPSLEILFHPASVHFRYLKGLGLDFTLEKEIIRRGRIIGGDEPKGKKKIGRNEPCPCGSGFKYKKCCMKKEGKR